MFISSCFKTIEEMEAEEADKENAPAASAVRALIYAVPPYFKMTSQSFPLQVR
jgi:hypothetical protein